MRQYDDDIQSTTTSTFLMQFWWLLPAFFLFTDRLAVEPVTLFPPEEPAIGPPFGNAHSRSTLPR